MKVEREHSENECFSPLVRANLGLGHDLEIVSELEYSQDEDRVSDAAVGLKWARLESSLGIGVETLALLPVTASRNGLGGKGSSWRRYGEGRSACTRMPAASTKAARPLRNGAEGLRNSSLSARETTG